MTPEEAAKQKAKLNAWEERVAKLFDGQKGLTVSSIVRRPAETEQGREHAFLVMEGELNLTQLTAMVLMFVGAEILGEGRLPK